MMKNRKWISKLSAVLLAVLLIVSTAVTAFASGIPAAPNPDDGPGSLTVHKYATFSTSSTPGTGLELPSDVADKLGSVLPGAKFALYRIEETWSETNPTGYRVTAATQAELDAGTAAFIASRTNGTAIGGEQTTDTNGLIKWDNLEMGYYLLVETFTPTGYNSAVPSIITMPIGYSTTGGNTNDAYNWDIHVYPKNVNDKDIEKEVDESKYYTVGDEVEWTIRAKVQPGLRSPDGTAYGTFVLTDVLDERLDFQATSATVKAIGGVATTLTTADYTQNVSGQTVTWSLTTAGIDKVLDVAKASAIEVTFTTIINQKATGGLPTIENGAELDFENHDGTTSGKYKIDDEDKPSINVGGIEFLKADSVDQSILLNGAEFKLARTEKDLHDGTFVKNPNTGADLIVVTGPDPRVAGSAGWGMFVGLPMDKVGNVTQDTVYYMVETKTPSKDYLLSKSAWVVTIKADEKYVNLGKILNQKVGDPPVDEPRPTFQLPTTGGIGTIVFAVAGIALIGVSAIMLLKTRRKKGTSN